MLAAVSLFAWGLSSPVASSPDDDFHLASIWCAAGDREAICAAGEESNEREVPKDLVVDSVCFAYQPTTSGACQGADFGDKPDETVVTPRGNFDGLYPPVYYAVASVFVGGDIESSVLVVRFMNAIIYVGLVAATWLLLPLHRRPALLVAAALSLVPLGMFIVPSTNPSGWAVLSATVLALSLIGFLETTSRQRVGLGVIAVLAALIGAGARADAAVYNGIAIVIAVILTVRAKRAALLPLIVVFLLAVGSVIFYLSTRQSEATSEGLAPRGELGVGVVGLALVNLVNIPNLWVGAFGHWGLGWLDTALPASVWVGTFTVFAIVAAVGMRGADGRRILSLVLLALALWIIPTVILVQTGAQVGGYVQPRYIYPLIIMFGVIALLRPVGDPLRFTRIQAAFGVVVLSAANSLALHTNLRRYVVGMDSGGINLDNGIEWWWAAAPSPMTVWILGSLSFGIVLAAIALPLTGRTVSTFLAKNEPIPAS